MKKSNLISSVCILTFLAITIVPGFVQADDSLRVRRLSEKVKELKDINDDMNKRLSRMRNEIEKKADQNKELEEEIEKLSQQKISLGQTLDLASQELREQKKLTERYESQLEENADDYQKDMQGDLLEAIKRNRETEASIPGLIEAVRNPLQDRIARLQEEIASAKMAAEEAKSRMMLAEQQKQDALREMAQFRSDNESLKREFDDINRKLSQQLSLNDKANEKIEAVERQTEQQKDAIYELTQQNKKINSELSARKERTEELSRVKERNEFLEEQIAMYAEREQNIGTIRAELEQIQKPLLEEIARLESEVDHLSNVITQKDTAIQVLRNKTWDQANTSGQGDKTVEDLMAIRAELDKAVELIAEKNGR